jgi:hypothetical protein
VAPLLLLLPPLLLLLRLAVVLAFGDTLAV